MKKKLFIIVFLSLIFSSCSFSDNVTEPNTKTQNANEQTTIDWYINFSWFANVWGDDPVSREITSRTGVNVNYIVPSGNETERLYSMIASKDLPDILTLGNWEPGFNDLVAQDMLASLNELADEYDYNFYQVADELRLNWYRNADGNVYGYPNASYSPGDYKTESNQSFLVREDIYEAIGRPDMTTPEGFLQALIDAKEQFPTVDGEPLIPLGLQEFTATGNSALEEYLQNFLAVPYEENGIIYDRFTDGDYITWLKTLRKANEMGLMPLDVFVDKRTQMEEKIAQKRYFSMLYQWSDCQTQLKQLHAENPDECYIAVDGPKNSNQDPHTLSGPGIQGWTLTMISNDSPYKEQAFKLMTFLMSEEGQKLLFAGVEGNSYDVIDGEIVFKKEMLDMLHTDRKSFDLEYGSSATHWPLMDNALALRKGFVPPDDECIGDIKQWTYQYSKNNSIYAFSGFKPGTPVAIAKEKIDYARGELLPKLILAESEDEFDRLYGEFLQLRDEDGFDSVQQEYQGQLYYNKERLGIEQ